MSEKHLPVPKHLKSNSKEMRAALQVIEYLQKQNVIYPSANIHTGDLAGVIGVGLGTVTPEEVARIVSERVMKPTGRVNEVIEAY